MNTQPLVDTIDTLSITPQQKQFCIQKLQASPTPETIKSVIFYLTSLVNQKQFKSQALKQEVNFYDQVLKILNSHPTTPTPTPNV